MDDFNPYESPPQRPPRRGEKPRDLALAVLGLVAGVSLLGITGYAYFARGVIFVWTLGGGIGVLMIGAMKLFYYVEDRRATRHRVRRESKP